LYYCGELHQNVFRQTARGTWPLAKQPIIKCLKLTAKSQQLTATSLVQKRTKKRHPKTKLPVFGREYSLSCGATVVNCNRLLFTKQPKAHGL